MTNSADAIVELKNQLLYQQVEVEHPTPESLNGRTLYQQDQTLRSVESLNPIPTKSAHLDDIYLVDFHRLTISFALLQASQFSDKSDRNNMIEFLTQIMYSEPCDLYLGFEQGEAVAAAIITRKDNSVLMSDVVVKPQSQFVDIDNFVSQLYAKLDFHPDNFHSFLQR